MIELTKSSFEHKLETKSLNPNYFTPTSKVTTIQASKILKMFCIKGIFLYFLCYCLKKVWVLFSWLEEWLLNHVGLLLKPCKQPS